MQFSVTFDIIILASWLVLALFSNNKLKLNKLDAFGVSSTTT